MSNNILLDYPSKSILFQDPATDIMEFMVNFHHDICFILGLISIMLFYYLTVVNVLCLKKTNTIVTTVEGSNKEKNVYNNFVNKNTFLFNHNEKRFRYQSHKSSLEVIWTALPMIILAIILIPSLSLLYYLQPLEHPLVTIKVVGSQWFWTYEYGIKYMYNSKNLYFSKPNMEKFEDSSSWNTFTKNGITEIESYMIQTKDLEFGEFRLLEVDNKLVIPEQVVVRFLVTSTDVLHSWSVPSLGIKIDACPGRLNEIMVRANRCSIYYGQCSEICGVFHGFMPIVVETVSVLDYYKYLFNTSFFQSDD